MPSADPPPGRAGIPDAARLSAIDLRPVVAADIPALLAIETRSFATDRLSPRAFRHLLTRARADTLLACSAGRVLGYAVIFHRSGARVARLHSLAVDPAARGLGIGAALLLAAERAATQRRLTRLRLAVRADNDAGIALYRSRGYTELGRELAYYTDGMSAIRMEKALAVA